MYVYLCITKSIWLKTVKIRIPQFKSTVPSDNNILESKVNCDYILIYSL